MLDRISSLYLKIHNTASIQSLMTFYRCLSTVVIGVFYIIFTEDNSTIKYSVPALICVSSLILNYLYTNSNDDRKYVTILLIVETVYISAIIFITGGSNSPFVWYMFNSLIVSFVLLDSIKATLLCLFTYLISIIVVNLTPYVKGDLNVNVILCLILSTGLLHVLFQCMHNVVVKNVELENANVKIAETMKHVLELYDTMHVFTVSDSKEDIINTTLERIAAITKSNKCGFLSYDDNHLIWDELNGRFEKHVLKLLQDQYTEMTSVNEAVILNLPESNYVFYPVIRNVNIFGVIVFETSPEATENMDHITYICELTAILLEKLQLEKVNSDLLINSEQNRIATEIHDGVLQNLFSVSCYIYTLIKKRSMDSQNEITAEHLNTIRGSITDTIAELRSVIYSLSLYKNGPNAFIDDIKKKIDEIMSFSDLNIRLEVTADTEQLSLMQKKSLYRIICELLHNSLKHSSAKEIKINLNIIETNLILQFYDNGVGFNYKQTVDDNKHGIGLKNIQYLIGILHGRYSFESLEPHGTLFETTIPL